MQTARQVTAIALLIGALGVLAVALPGHGAPAAEFTIIAGQTQANGDNNFNGTIKGQMVITVPLGATVHIVFKNQGILPHSLQVIPATGPLPAVALPSPVFPGAQVPNPQIGIQPKQMANVQFTAAKAGKYRMICGFPGHALLGMWANLIVAPSATVKPSMTIAK
jgi:sulfocyanin